MSLKSRAIQYVRSEEIDKSIKSIYRLPGKPRTVKPRALYRSKVKTIMKGGVLVV